MLTLAIGVAISVGGLTRIILQDDHRIAKLRSSSPRNNAISFFGSTAQPGPPEGGPSDHKRV
jgi:hypothetical protein